jgi:pyruvate dehydrogenase E2 component (dihydrolipoamide acetyltransferase)
MCAVMRKAVRRPRISAPERLHRATISPPVVSPDLPDFSQWGPVAIEPLRSVRKATARQMALAWSQIPHVSNQGEADVTALEALRKRHAPSMVQDGGRLTLTVFAAKAAVAALKRFPRFNASLDMAGEQIIYKQYFHVGVAVDSPRGLIVPVLRDVDRKSVRELAVDLQVLVARAREGKTSLEELQGGTFTITNAGAVGGGHLLFIFFHVEENEPKEDARVPLSPARRRGGRSTRKLAPPFGGLKQSARFFRPPRRCSARDKGDD